MIALLRRNPLIAFLGAVSIVLAAILLAELAVLGGDRSQVGARRAAPAEAKLLPPIAPVAADQAYPETTTRPLFIATRRPAPEVVAAAASTFQRGQFTLNGVIVAGGSRTAMLREKANGRVHRVETGGEVNGVKVVQIDPTSVLLGVGDEREMVPLVVQRPGATPGQPGAPPPTAALTQGPFGPPTSAFPAPVAGAAPPGAPGQPFGASGMARSAQPQPGAPGAPAAPGATPNPQGAAAPMSPEELMARRRARRAQQNQ